MQIIFNSECDYIKESIIFMARYYNQEDFIDLKEHLKKNSGYTRQVEKILTTMNVIYEEIEARLTLPEEMRDCFKPLGGEEIIDNSLADFILLETDEFSKMSLKEVRKELVKKFRENPKLFMNRASFQLEEDGISNEFEFIQAIEELPSVDDGMKWKIWHAYKNYEQYVDKLMDQVEKIVPIIKEVYQKHQEKFSSFIQYWEDKTKDRKSFEEAFHQHVQFSFEDNSIIYVRPSFMGCNGMRLRDMGKETLTLFIGWMFKDENIINSSRVTAEELCARLKLLSDPSKYEILKLIKNKGLYGAQLAEQMNLTTATISHHVSTLSNASLLTFEKDASRIYYHLNKDQVGFLLDQIRTDLLED